MAISGQITVATAGTAVQGPSTTGTRFALKAHPDNTDTIWVGNDDSTLHVSATSGFPLNPGESIIRECLSLASVWVDADVNGSKLCWFLME